MPIRRLAQQSVTERIGKLTVDTSNIRAYDAKAEFVVCWPMKSGASYFLPDTNNRGSKQKF